MNVEHEKNNYPKIHNAMWPGLVGKGSPGAEPCLSLDTMLELTARAQVDGVRFDGVDLFLFDPHVSIDITGDALSRLADKIRARGLVIGSVVAPVWGPTGGGSAMGTEAERKQFLGQVRKACAIASGLRQLGARPHGVVRIDSACGVGDWAANAEANQEKIADTFRAACDIANDYGERLAAEGEICWGGMHSWRRMLDLLERVNRPRVLGFQADMAHTLLYTLGYNSAEDALLPAGWDWSEPGRLDEALKTVADALRPWTIDFHVAQNDATVHGSGNHDKTGHHCLPNDPNGKLQIARHAGLWLRDPKGGLTRAIRHICWDGCMFPNAVMMQQETWNEVLRAMIAVREAHGWREELAQPFRAESRPVEIANLKKAKAKPIKTKAGKAKPRKSTALRSRVTKRGKKAAVASRRKVAKRPSRRTRGTKAVRSAKAARKRS